MIGSMAEVVERQSEVLRHRAAIRRNDLSLPLKCVVRDGLLEATDRVFDYGCGHGDDLRHLQDLGFVCDGWDPVHRSDGRSAASGRLYDAVKSWGRHVALPVGAVKCHQLAMTADSCRATSDRGGAWKMRDHK